jgi:hypothetical protein
MNEAVWLFELENCGDGIAVSLPNRHDNFALAALVPGETPITAMCFDIGGAGPGWPAAAGTL